MDLGSGIRKKPIPDPGSRGKKGTGSRIWIRNTAAHYKLFPHERTLTCCCDEIMLREEINGFDGTHKNSSNKLGTYISS